MFDNRGLSIGDGSRDNAVRAAVGRMSLGKQPDAFKAVEHEKNIRSYNASRVVVGCTKDEFEDARRQPGANLWRTKSCRPISMHCALYALRIRRFIFLCNRRRNR